MALFSKPGSLALSADGSILYVSDYVRSRIRKIVVATRTVTSIAGSGNAAWFVAFMFCKLNPSLDMHSNLPFVLLSQGRRFGLALKPLLFKLCHLHFSRTTGVGRTASFNNPLGLSIDPNGLYLYVADYAKFVSSMLPAACVIVAYFWCSPQLSSSQNCNLE